MKRNFAKVVSAVLCAVMLLSMVPFGAIAANSFDVSGSEKNDGYYNLISKKDWDIAPGITESEIVLNNDSGTKRQVLHVMEADMNNEYTKVIGSYAEMNTSKFQTSTMDKQASWVEENWGWNVVGAMNTCLSWYSGYAADQVGKPLGFLMVDGEILWNACDGFPTVLVINKDVDANGNARPDSIPKVEMVTIRSSADLDGWEDQVIPASSGFIVKDGVNQYSVAHNDEAPRSVVGIKPDGTVVIMENDGRQSPFSAGMCMYELAEVMIGLGCSYAVNCDGGGSSTFLSQRPGEALAVNNSPSDGGLRPTTQGILFISTAPSDGTFARASVEADSQYYTPDSSVQFTAKGADVVGTAVAIPDDATWQLSDSSFGDIDQNGLFVSNGKTGTVSAQIVYNGETVGSCEINIVIPDAVAFGQGTMTIPYGRTSAFSVSASYGVKEVVTKDSDFLFSLSDETMGTLNGFELTATTDETVTGGKVIVTLSHNENVTSTMDVIYGKASEVVYDFENGFQSAHWSVEWLQRRKSKKNGDDIELVADYNNVIDTYPVSNENGMVHNGNGAGAVYIDTTYATINVSGASIYWLKDDVEYKNAASIGAWVYIPKDATSVDVRFCLTGVKDGKQVSIDVHPIKTGEVYSFEESGWHYCAVDVSGYDSIILKKAPAYENVNAGNWNTGFRMELYMQLSNGVTDDGYNWRTATGVKGSNIFYVDDLTVDYSNACDDRESPVYGAVSYVEPVVASDDKTLNDQRQTTTITNYSDIGFSVAVEDYNKINATGLNAASAKAFIDGEQVACDFNGKIMSIASTKLTNGVHTVKFAICDNAGNYSSISRKINVQVNDNNVSGVKIVPKSDTSMAFTGSQYWIDIIATNAEKVDTVTATLDLNNVNEWIPEHIETLYGFDVNYSLDKANENMLSLTIAKTGDVDVEGEAVLASIPVQTWEWKEEDYPGYYPPAGRDNDLNGNRMYDPYECWQEYVTHNFDIIVDPLAGKVVYTDGTSETFSGEKIQVDTEQQYGCWWSFPADNRYLFEGKSSWHLHVAGTANNKAATCTEDGYTGRVFCIGCACVTESKLGHVCDSADGCAAVLDWGTTVPATGHNYAFVHGVLQCSGCDKVFTGKYTDGKTYVDGVVVADGWDANNTHYYVSGVALTGSHLIDGTMYTFDDDGVYLPNYSFTGFYNDGNGWMYFLGNFQKKGFVVIDGDTYYFDDMTGYAPIGSFTLAEDRVYRVEGEKGKVIGGWDTFTVNGVERRRYYYSLRYYKNQWLEVDGETYYFNNEGYALIGKRAVAFSGEYLGGYEFDTDGKLLGAITGPFVDAESGYMYFAENGVMVHNKLVKYNDDYYFARDNYLLITWAIELTDEQTGGLLPAGEYNFGADGKLIMQNGPVVDAFNSAYLTFYKNGIRVYEEGLYEYDGGYYYVRPNGLLVTWDTYVSAEKANGLVPAGEYKFGADGKLIMLNGPVEDAYNAAYLNFYKDGIRIYDEGLYEYEGNYYYVRSNGLLLTWGMYVSEEMANGLLPAGEYKFGTDGKLAMLNGPVEDAYNAAYLNFYRDGIRIYDEGLYEYDGNYYYVRSNGLLLTWGMYVSEEMANGLLPAGEYKFGTDGKLAMLNGPVEDAYNAAYLNFYRDGIRIYDEGLYEYDGNYYYVRSNGLLLTWGTYVTEEMANGLLTAGEYKFGADGKLIMLNGPVEDAFNSAYLTFYKNGVRVYEEGLYEYEGNYYYVRSNGLLITWDTYISEDKANDLVPAGEYKFGADGKMVR